MIIAWLISTVMGFAGFIALLLIVLARKAPPIMTQTNQVTGVKEEGIFRWIGLFSVLPLLPTIVAGVRWLLDGHFWMVPVAFTVIAAALVGRHFWNTRHQDEPQDYIQPGPQQYLTPFPQPVAAPAQPAPNMGWSLDPNAPHWQQTQG